MARFEFSSTSKTNQCLKKRYKKFMIILLSIYLHTYILITFIIYNPWKEWQFNYLTNCIDFPDKQWNLVTSLISPALNQLGLSRSILVYTISLWYHGCALNHEFIFTCNCLLINLSSRWNYKLHYKPSLIYLLFNLFSSWHQFSLLTIIQFFQWQFWELVVKYIKTILEPL